MLMNYLVYRSIQALYRGAQLVEELVDFGEWLGLGWGRLEPSEEGVRARVGGGKRVNQ